MTLLTQKLVLDTYRRLAQGPEILLNERAVLGVHGVAIEDVLQAIVSHANGDVLLHGSPHRIDPGQYLALPGYATDHAGVAILKAIFSNDRRHRDRWTYPYFIDSANPLVIRVMNPRPGFERERGYVYLLEARQDDFDNEPRGSWQWRARRPDVRFLGRLEVERADFRYPVELVPWLDERYA